MAAQAEPAPGSTIPRPTPVKPVPPPLNSPEGRAAAKAAADARRAQEEARRRALPPWRRFFRAGVPWLAALFLVSLLGAMFLAGYGVMELGGQGMELHMGFVHLAEMFPLLLILFGFLGGDKFSGILGIVLFVLFGMQYAFLEAATPSVRALHPLNGAVLVALATMLAIVRPIWRRR